MSLLSGCCKAILSKVNRDIEHSRTKKAQKIAYEKTGEKLRKAKRKHRYIDGKKEYRKEYSKQARKIHGQHNFIDDVISNIG